MGTDFGQPVAVRVLVDATTDIGQRAARVMLAESSMSHVGLWDAPEAVANARSGPATDIEGYDVAISDRSDHIGDLQARCSVAGIPLVLWGDAPEIAPGGAAIPIVIGANVGSGLAESLVHHPSASLSSDDEVQISWTEPGTPLRNGTPVAFPDPVGMSWTKQRSPDRFVAFRDDEWAGAVVRLEGQAGERIIGVADQGAHLEALVLSATALCVIDGVYEPGVHQASDGGEHLVNRCASVELDFAVWRSTT